MEVISKEKVMREYEACTGTGTAAQGGVVSARIQMVGSCKRAHGGKTA